MAMRNTTSRRKALRHADYGALRRAALLLAAVALLAIATACTSPRGAGDGAQPPQEDVANGTGIQQGTGASDGNSGRNEQGDSDAGGVLTDGTHLHYMLPEGHEHRLIGDVHPYYDHKSETWYMFYLDTSGQFNSRLLTSKDAISWEPKELNIRSNLTNYPVLGIVESEGKYFSYYAEYVASVSENLIDWGYAGLKYTIPQDTAQFPGGIRDPYVAYDPDSKRYYSIGLSYPKRVASENIYISNLALNRSTGDSLAEWEREHKPVFAETRQSQDPEVPQLVKIGDRWYVITSIYGETQHGVGGTSYLIGDPGKNPFEVDWQSKPLHKLTSEDLCAAQIVAYNDRHLLFGWLPKDYTSSTWGGNINLALEVFAYEDGTLGTKMFDGISDLIRGEQTYSLERQATVEAGATFEAPTPKRMDMSMSFRLDGERMKLVFYDKKVEIIIHNEGDRPHIEIRSNTFTTSRLELRAGALDGDNTLRLVAEGNMLELFLNDAYTVHSRIGVNLGEDTLVISAEGKAQLTQLDTYRLKFMEEIR